MTPNLDLSEPADAATERPPPGPIGTWTIDHTHSSVALTWRTPRLGTVTGRLHGLGIVHVAVLPPVGMIRFDRPAVLPVLTMALDPASVDSGDGHLDTALCGPGAFDVTRHRWWTLRSESLELLPTGAWQIMATLTARGTTALVEPRSEVEAGHGEGDLG
jgi:polyisoprenoid-binding protein YceI